mgnify:CR=1 FL=1
MCAVPTINPASFIPEIASNHRLHNSSISCLQALLNSLCSSIFTIFHFYSTVDPPVIIQFPLIFHCWPTCYYSISTFISLLTHLLLFNVHLYFTVDPPLIFQFPLIFQCWPTCYYSMFTYISLLTHLLSFNVHFYFTVDPSVTIHFSCTFCNELALITTTWHFTFPYYTIYSNVSIELLFLFNNIL